MNRNSDHKRYGRLMVGFVIVGVLVVLSVVGLLYAESHKPRGRDRGGFEVHPGPDRSTPWSGGPPGGGSPG